MDGRVGVGGQVGVGDALDELAITLAVEGDHLPIGACGEEHPAADVGGLAGAALADGQLGQPGGVVG
jgi:hypothetical protein